MLRLPSDTVMFALPLSLEGISLTVPLKNLDKEIGAGDRNLSSIFCALIEICLSSMLLELDSCL